MDVKRDLDIGDAGGGIDLNMEATGGGYALDGGYWRWLFS